MSVSNWLTTMYKDAYGSGPEVPGMLQPWTEFTLKVRKPDEVQQEWKEDTRPGFIAFLALVGPLIVLLSLIPTLYHCCTKSREQEKTTKGVPMQEDAPPDIRGSLPEILRSSGAGGARGNLNLTTNTSDMSILRMSNDPTRGASGRLVSGDATYVPPVVRGRRGTRGYNNLNQSSEMSQMPYENSVYLGRQDDATDVSVENVENNGPQIGSRGD